MGALAVSLGVGFAIANSPGVAHAGTDSASSVSSGSKGDGDAPAVGAERQPSAADSDTSASVADGGSSTDGEQATDEKSPVDVDPAVDQDVSGDEEDAEKPDDSEEDAEDDPADSPTAPTQSEEEPVAAEPADEEPADEVSSAAPVDGVDASHGASPLDSSPPATEAEEPITESADLSGSGEDEGSTPEADSVEPPSTDRAPDVGSVVPLTVADTRPTRAVESATLAPTDVPAENVASVDVMTAVVSSILSPFADPHAPARAPWFDALLAWVRRQINHTLFNKSPVYGPIQTEQLVTGQLLIDLQASDPNGDPLTYRIVQPEHGVVLRDAVTGQFIYTPTDVVTGEPLDDSFKVVISDSSDHPKFPLRRVFGLFHFLARAIGIAQADDVTVTVPVTVNPIVQLPPVVVTTGSPIYSVGSDPVKVLSGATITDADSPTLSLATVILTNGVTGDMLHYVAPPSSPVTAQWNPTSKMLTLSGTGTLAEYEAALKAVTFSTTQVGLPRVVSINVKDVTGLQSLVPGLASIVVLAVAPLVVVAPVALGTAGKAVTVSPVIAITDLDSAELSSATVEVSDPAVDDVLGYGSLPPGVVATPGAGSVTFTGAASVAEYQQLLQSVTLTSSSAGIKTVTFTVVDDQGESSVPAGTVVTVLALPTAWRRWWSRHRQRPGRRVVR